MDEKSHNSIFVATFQSRPGLVRKFRHDDMDSLGALIDEFSPDYTRTLVIVEGFYRSVPYSM